MNKPAQGLAAVIAAVGLFGLSAGAGIVLDNTSGLTAAGNGEATIDYGTWAAEAFKTDGNSYNFDTSGQYCFYVRLGDLSSGTLNLVAKVAEIDSYGNATYVQNATLGTLDTIPGSGFSYIKLTPQNSFSLGANTTYYLVLGNSTSGGASFDWRFINSFSNPGSWSFPVSSGDLTWTSSTDQGSTWDISKDTVHSGTGSPYLLQVAVPEPHAYTLLAGLGLLCFVAYRNRDRLARLA